MFIELAQCAEGQSHKTAELLGFHVWNLISPSCWSPTDCISFLLKNRKKCIFVPVVCNLSGSAHHCCHFDDSVIPSKMSAVSWQRTNTRHHPLGVECSQHESWSATVQTTLFPQNRHCGSHLWTRTQPLTSRKWGVFEVNESRFHVGRAALTAGGDLCVTLRGFPCFYDAENIVLPLSCWYTVAPGYH